MYKWLLDKMIFLFREMSEETCRKENPYQKEYEDTLQEFQIKYGIFGEKLSSNRNNIACIHTSLPPIFRFQSRISAYKVRYSPDYKSGESYIKPTELLLKCCHKIADN